MRGTHCENVVMQEMTRSIFLASQPKGQVKDGNNILNTSTVGSNDI